MLADVLPYLACPHCGADLTLAGRVVRCASGHGFDIARQGYVNLLSGRSPVSGDSPDMVAARADFLAAGHYAPIARAIVAAAGFANAAADDATDAAVHGVASAAGGAAVGAARATVGTVSATAGTVAATRATAAGVASGTTSGAFAGAGSVAPTGGPGRAARGELAGGGSGVAAGDTAGVAANEAAGAVSAAAADVGSGAAADGPGRASLGDAAGDAAGGTSGAVGAAVGDAAGTAATVGAVGVALDAAAGGTADAVDAAAGGSADAVDAAAGGAAAGPATSGAGCVADLGAGTGYYLAALLDAAPRQVGLALEISKAALRRAARAQPRLGAVGCDAWGRLPVRTGAISVALNVFAPRNPAELDRILAPDGVLVVVSPTTDHLAGLVADLGLLTVAPDKARRVAEQLAPLEPSTQDTCEFELALSHADVLSLVGMGPSAWHIGREALGERVAALPEPVRTTASVVVTAFRRA